MIGNSFYFNNEREVFQYLSVMRMYSGKDMYEKTLSEYRLYPDRFIKSGDNRLYDKSHMYHLS